MQTLKLLMIFATLAVATDPRPDSPSRGPLKFERIVIDADFPGGYQVEVADVNGDKRPDIVALGGSTLAWYENPTWKKRVVSTSKQTPDIISSATADLDGDGKAEIAIAYDFAMNEPRRGKLLLAIQGATSDDSWTFTRVFEAGYNFKDRLSRPGNLATGQTTGGSLVTKPADLPLPLGAIPSIHRIRWGHVFGVPVPEPDKVPFKKDKPQLIVAPIFGPSASPPTFNQEPARLSLFYTGTEPKSGRWQLHFLGTAPVLHAIEVIDIDEDGVSTVLGASNSGVTSFECNMRLGLAFNPHQLAPGAPGIAPKKGASEVHLGKLKDGRKFLGTVEPWHGTDVAIYMSESLKPLKFGPRLVIDSTLKEGHALWVADIDGDGDDEVFAGDRGGEGGILMYDFDGKTWDRTVLDPAVTAQDLRGGDIDGDGTPDVVAIGGKSHNVVWYRPIRPAK